MRHMSRPEIDFAVLYSQCMNQKNKKGVKKRLRLAQAAILGAATRYEELGQTLTFFQFVQPIIPAGGATHDDLVNLYQSGLVRKKGAGRWAYDKLLASAHRGICPLCGQRAVGTLDHYLPKGEDWTLSITPDNLIPACRDCNWAKLEVRPQDQITQSFHPYFDPVDDTQWLCARVEHSESLSATFYVGETPAWTADRRFRADHHFRLFNLAKFYATQAAVELVNLKERLAKLHANGGAVGVRSHLVEEALSRRQAHVNSWQTALYYALAEDNAFCSGAFANV
jgi:hypothetical protein